MKKILLLFFIYLVKTGFIYSQPLSEDIFIGKKLVFHSKLYNEERNILISLPKSYNENNNDYPVLYRLDGEWCFIPTLGEVEMLVYLEKAIPEIIFVCIQNTDRGRDMLPSVSKYAPKDASNEKFLLFMKTELVPYINSNYRVSGFKILCGQSTSGMFTIFSFIREPDLFNAFISISPSFADCKSYLQELAKNASMTDERRKSMLYLARGGDEREIAIGLSTSHVLDILIDKGKDRNDKFSWKFSVFNDEGHVPRSGIYEGLKWVFQQVNNDEE